MTDFTITMNLTDSETTTRIILESGARKWSMTIGDSSVVAKLMKDVMRGRAVRNEGVALDDGGVLEFERTPYGAIVGCEFCSFATALRLVNEIREAGDDAQRHLDPKAA